MSEPQKLVGRRSVLEAFLAGRRPIRRLLMMEGARGDGIDRIIALAKEQRVPIHSADKDTLREMAEGVPHQGVIAEAGPLPVLDVPDLLEIARAKGEQPLFVALDKIEDPMNAGAILRSACAAGCHGAILLSAHAVPLSGTVARASAGAIEHLPIAQVVNLDRALRDLKEAGVWIAGAEMSAPKTLWETDLDRPLCLVIGAEGRGLRELTIKRCDMLVKIPMVGPIDSLNASVSAAILIYEALRQRGESSKSK